MWSKILTILNTLLIVVAAGLGGFAYQQIQMVSERTGTEITDLAKGFEQINKQQAELLKNPLLALGINMGDTLKLEDDKLIGFVQVSGFLVESEATAEDAETTNQPKILAFKNPTDDSLTEFIESKLSGTLETSYDKDEEYYYIPFSCEAEVGASEGLSELGPDKLGSIRLFFGPEDTETEDCPVSIAKWQVL